MSSNAAGKRGAKQQEAGFLKTFPSDIDDTQVQKLLMEVKQIDVLYKDFTTRELKTLSQIITALRFEPGDQITVKGEEASFVGILLKGAAAYVWQNSGSGADGASSQQQQQQPPPQQQQQPLKRGEIFGELEFYESSSPLRKQNLIATTSGVIGILTYDDLRLIGLTSIDLHMRLMQALSVSAIKKMRVCAQVTIQYNNAVNAAALREHVSGTPKQRSRRTSLSGKENASAAATTTTTANGTSSTIDPPGQLTRSNSDVSDDSGSNNNIATGQPQTPQHAIIHTSGTASSSSSIDPPSDLLLSSLFASSLLDTSSESVHNRSTPRHEGPELLFKARMKKNPNVFLKKKMVVEADLVMGLGVGAAGGNDATMMFPSLVDKPHASPPATANGDRPFASNGGEHSTPIQSSSSISGTNNATSSTSNNTATSLLFDKTNSNYILYALRNRVSKQEDLLEEQSSLLSSVQLDLKIIQDANRAYEARIREREEKCVELTAELKKEEERAVRSEKELSEVKEELTQKQLELDTLTASKQSLLDAQHSLILQMHNKLISHEDLLDSGMSLLSTVKASAKTGIGAAVQSGSKTMRHKDMSSSSGLESPNSFVSSATGNKRKFTFSSSGVSSSSLSSILKNLDPSTSSTHLSDYFTHYETMLLKLRDRISEQERTLLAMYQWKQKASEIAQGWEQERGRLKDRIKHCLYESDSLKQQKDSYKLILKFMVIRNYVLQYLQRKQVREVYKKLVGQTTRLMKERKENNKKSLVKKMSDQDGEMKEQETDDHTTTTTSCPSLAATQTLASSPSLALLSLPHTTDPHLLANSHYEMSEELAVRNHQKLMMHPWGNCNNVRESSGGNGNNTNNSNTSTNAVSISITTSHPSSSATTRFSTLASSISLSSSSHHNQHRPPCMRLLLESLDTELDHLSHISSSLIQNKKEWQETAASFFERNIELTQGKKEEEEKVREQAKTLVEQEKQLMKSTSQITSLQATLSSLEVTHKTKLSTLNQQRSLSQLQLRQKKHEVSEIYERHIELQRKVRENEVKLYELEQKKERLGEMNVELVSEQKRLVHSIQQAKELETVLMRGNTQQFNTLLMKQANQPNQQKMTSSASRRALQMSGPLSTITGGGGLMSHASSSATLGPLISPRQQRAMVKPSAAGGGGASTSASSTSLYHTHSSGIQSTASIRPILSASPSSTNVPLIAVEHFPNAPNALLPQWASYAAHTLPTNIGSMTARPAAPSITSSTSSLHSTQPQSQTARIHSTTTSPPPPSSSAKMPDLKYTHAAKVALQSAMQRDSLDRALFRAAKAGLGRGGSNKKKNNVNVRPATTNSLPTKRASLEDVGAIMTITDLKADLEHEQQQEEIKQHEDQHQQQQHEEVEADATDHDNIANGKAEDEFKEQPQIEPHHATEMMQQID